jgi:adenosylcobinamide-phosphate guanylyltransferase
MAGGKGERLGVGGVEKPLLEFRGRPLIEHVLSALNKSQTQRVIAVTSPRTPCTTRWAREADIQVVRALGHGYIEDYVWTCERLGLQSPILVIAADLPLIDYRLIDRVIKRYAKADSAALGVYLPREFCEEAKIARHLGFAVDAKKLVPTGINIVDASHLDQPQQETTLVVRDESLLYNINTRDDLRQLVRRASAVAKSKRE